MKQCSTLMMLGNVVVYIICFYAFVVPAKASILTFDSCGSSSAAILDACYGGSINPNYGNRIAGSQSDAIGNGEREYGNNGEGYTPNILTTINGGFGWASGFGSLNNAIFADGYIGKMSVKFTPDPGYKARILGFSMGAMLPPEGGYSGIIAEVLDDSERIIWSQSYDRFGEVDIHQILLAEGTDGSALTLVFNLLSLSYDPSNGYFDRELIGFDNIVFSQVAAPSLTDPRDDTSVPEPSTFFMACIGSLLIRMLTKRY